MEIAGARTVCGSCVAANETGTDCVDSCNFEYTWQTVGGERKCVDGELLEPRGCDGVPGSGAYTNKCGRYQRLCRHYLFNVGSLYRTSKMGTPGASPLKSVSLEVPTNKSLRRPNPIFKGIASCVAFSETLEVFPKMWGLPEDQFVGSSAETDFKGLVLDFSKKALRCP